METESYLQTVKLEAKKALIASSTRGQIITGFKLVAAAILLMVSSYLGTTLNRLQAEQNNDQRISQLEFSMDIYETIPEDLNTTITKQDQMLKESRLHKSEVMAKLRALEKQQTRLETIQASQFKLDEKRYQLTLDIQAEQQRRTHPVKQSTSNRDDILLLKTRINTLTKILNKNPQSHKRAQL